MSRFEYDEQEEREALLEDGYERGYAIGRARAKIKVARELIASGVVTLEALKSSDYYSDDELVAIAKP
ncbi:MAG: hypothetical protein ACI3U2_06235 [Anaerovibrio sp.]